MPTHQREAAGATEGGLGRGHVVCRWEGGVCEGGQEWVGSVREARSGWGKEGVSTADGWSGVVNALVRSHSILGCPLC